MYREGLKRYLEDLASAKPAPGGGSAAALVAATGVSLISMVCNFTVGKEKYQAQEEEIKKVLAACEDLRQKLTNLVDQDVSAYKQVSSAYKLPNDSPEEKKKRAQVIPKALKEALSIPLEVCQLCQQAIKLSPLLAKKGNLNLISDLGVAVLVLESAFQSGLLNVEINLKGIKDEQFILQIREILEPLEKEVLALKQEVMEEVKKQLLK